MVPILGFLGLVGLLALVVRSQRHDPAVPRHEAVRRVLYHIERRSIRELSEGEAAVVRGTAIAITELLIAPLSRQRCIGYHLRIHGSDGDLLVDQASCTAFAVADPTGTVAVSADGLELAVTEAPTVVMYPPLPPEVRRRIRIVPPQLPLCATEGVLLPGATVAVCGVLHPAIVAGGLYREGEIRYQLVASPTFPLVASPDSDLAAAAPRPIRPEDLPR